MRCVLVVCVLLLAAPSASALTLKQYKNRIRAACLGDTALAGDPIDDSLLRDYINDARHLTADLSGGLEKDTIIVTVDQQVDYLLPSDFGVPGHLITPPHMTVGGLSGNLAGAETTIGDFIGRNAPAQSGPPMNHLTWGRDTARIYIDPPPAGEFNMIYLYSSAPTDLNVDTDVCDLPRSYQVAAIEFAKVLTYEQLGMPEKQKTSAQMFDRLWQGLYVRYTARRRAQETQGP